MNTKESKILEELPAFAEDGDGSSWTGLNIEGLVKSPVILSRSDIAELEQRSLTEDFRCEEGWVVPDQAWAGVPVSVILERAKPLPAANYVALSAGDYTVSLTLDEVARTGAILATRLNGEPLPGEHGSPCRLVAPSKACYYSVKWVDRIELTSMAPSDTGQQVAKARTRQTNIMSA